MEATPELGTTITDEGAAPADDSTAGLLAYIRENGRVNGFGGTPTPAIEGIKTQANEILSLLASGSVKAKMDEASNHVSDTAGKWVYTFDDTLRIKMNENSILPTGNYRLTGYLVVDESRVASDYIIFNVNRIKVEKPIQESNL